MVRLRTNRWHGLARVSRRVGELVFFVAVSALAAACSSSGTGASPPKGSAHDVVLAAAQRTEAARTATFTLSLVVSGTPTFGGLTGPSGSAATPISVTMTGSGAFDFTDKVGDLTMHISGGKAMAGATVELRLIGGNLYLGAPTLSSIDGGKSWVHVDASAFERQQGQGAGALGGFSGGDPTQVLGLLQKLNGTITEVGPDEINGVPTTHYRATVDLASGQSSSSTTSVFSQQIAQAFGFGSLPADIWVDSGGRARRIGVSISLFGIAMKAQEDLGDFGAPVVVTAPPASQVADGTSLLQNGGLKGLLGQAPLA